MNIEKFLKLLLNLIIISVIMYIVINLFIYLLPVILILIGVYYLYKLYREFKNKDRVESNSKKKDNVLDAEIICEKFDR